MPHKTRRRKPIQAGTVLNIQNYAAADAVSAAAARRVAS
jgi:hypothetical protein